MARFTRSTDVKQGFDFKPDKQTPVGHLLSLQVGDAAPGKGIVFAPDLTGIRNPARPGTAAGIVAVTSELDWDTSPAGTISIGGRISTPNKQSLLALVLGGWTDMRVLFQLEIYEYDPAQGSYFVSFGSPAVLSGILEKQGDELALDVETAESTEVQQPKNYAFRIGIRPGAIAQRITLATNAGQTITKTWG